MLEIKLFLLTMLEHWATNAVTINQNSLNFQGFSSSPNPEFIIHHGQTVNIVYSGATKGWIPVSDDDVTNEDTTNSFY